LGRKGEKRNEAAVFLGEFTHNVDAESRVALPAPLREAAAEALGKGLVLTSTVEPCIVAYTTERFAELLAALDTDASVSRTAARDFKRALGSRAVVVVPDRQGRIRLPDHLRKHAGIRRQVVVVGVVDAIEFWEPGTYRSREGARRAIFERLAPRTFG